MQSLLHWCWYVYHIVRAFRRTGSIAPRSQTSARPIMQKCLQRPVMTAEQQCALLADADTAYEQMCKSGEAYDAAEVHRYILACVRGESAERSQPKPWRK